MILILYQCRADPQNSNWLNHLVHYITENSATYQTMLIVDKDPRIDNITIQILKSVPSLKISFNKAKFDNAKNLTNSPLFQSPRSTLFILIQFSNDNLYSSRLTEQIKFISEISPVRIRPKFLVIVLHQENSILRKDFLRSLWSSHFLDFTILELVQKTAKSDFLLGNHQIVVMMHFYNPFTQTYVRKKWSPKSDFFPNKLIDMNGFEMLVGSFNHPPYIYLKRNVSGYLIDASGPGIFLRNLLSNVMNFTIKEIPYDDNYKWGNFDCDRNKSTGLLRKIEHNKIRFITNRGVISKVCADSTERTYPLQLSRSCPVLPVFYKKLPSTSIETTFYTTIIIIGSLIVFKWLLLRSLKFDENFWTPSHIFQIVLAIPIHWSPRKFTERIVFGSFLIASLFYSSTLFSLLSGVKLTRNSEVKIESFEDLQNANLQLRMTKFRMLSLEKNEENKIVQNLVKKSKIMNDYKECIEYLVAHKNISCIMESFLDEFAAETHNNKKGNRVVEIGKQCFSVNYLSMHLEPRSPYVERFNQILLRTNQVGLTRSFTSTSFLNVNTLKEVERQMLTNIKRPLLLIALNGFLISFVVFICELLLSFFSNRNRR